MRALLTVVSVAGLVLAVSTAAMRAQRQASASATDSPVHVVHIDAVVMDARGGPVGGLGAKDFDLLEDGRPQAIDDVQFVKSESRLFAIYLDEYRVSSGADADLVREALARFVDDEVTPRDQVVVMKPLDSLLKIRLSHDVDEAKRIIATFDGRKGDYAARTAYERDMFTGTPERIESLRAQVTMSALNALVAHLDVPGEMRKSLIVVAEDVVRTSRQRRLDYLTTFETVLRSANRAHVAIYPVDPSSADTVADEDHAAMRELASDTAGRTIAGVDHLNTALAGIATDAGAYYVFTYRAAHREDGAFHNVVVRARRSGLQVRARSGYWAPSSDDRLREALLARSTAPAPALVTPQHISGLVKPWFGVSRGDANQSRVTFVWEPALSITGNRAARPARLILRATGADGAVLFEGAVRPTGPGTIDQHDTPARVVFDATPGRVRIQMTIQDATQKPLDVDSRDLTVRDFRSGVSIATPEILRARTALEFRTLDADPEAAPVSSREFSRNERLLIRVAAYAPGNVRPSVTARLLGPTGDVLRSLTVDVMPDGENKVDVPLAGLASSDYLLELTAKSPGGDAKDIVNFRVTN